MKKIFVIIIIFIIYHSPSFSDISQNERYFYIGKMKSHNENFTLYFKTRNKSILAKGEYYNYITDYPQDLYIYDHSSKKDYPIISYDWFPKKIKTINNIYKYPMFPEDFAYYLLGDNNTLVLVSAKKNFYQNLKFDIKKNELSLLKSNGKLDFIISSYARSCGYESIGSNYKCEMYKPLISSNLISSIE